MNFDIINGMLTEEKNKEDALDRETLLRSAENPNEFKEIIDRYWDRLFRFVRRISSFSEHDIEDVLQETFLKAYRNMHLYSHSYRFSTWLYAIARGITIDAWRKKRHEPVDFDITLEDYEFVSTSRHEMEELFEKKLQNEEVAKIMKSLPSKYREILVLRYLEEKSYEEIMDIVKKPKGTVASLLARGRELFKKEALNKKQLH